MEPLPLAQSISLAGKSAIVTGGAMGIGFGIAYRLAEAGASVLIADMNAVAAQEAAAKLVAKGWKATAIAADVSDAAQVEQMIAAAGSLDILVNNAGIYPIVPLMQLSTEQFDKVISVNLRGVFLATKAAAAQMIARGAGGRIINITSIDALHPSMVGLPVYDASKHGAWGLTKSAALELAPHGILVNAIAPGPINTPGAGANATGAAAEAARKAEAAHIPLGRLGEPDDIGKATLFLASDLASFITGTQIVVDGGTLLA